MRGSRRSTGLGLLLMGWVWGVCAGSVVGASGSTLGELRRVLTELPGQGVVCGAVVADAQSGRVLLRVNGDRALVPASNAKLFVLAAALDGLGSGFEFRTVLARRGRDFVVIGDGDPSLGDPRIAEERGEAITVLFDRWADALRQRGVSRVDGGLIIDESIFDDRGYHPDWTAGDRKKWYGAPVGALNFNDNCIDVTVWPASADGGPALSEASPASALVTIVNQCRSGGKGTPVIDRRDETFEYVLSGRCGQRVTLQSVAVPDPGLFFASALREGLKKRGIAVVGDVRRERVRDAGGKVPADCEIVAGHRTPLPVVLSRVGKNSQNLFAECLLKRLGYEWATRHRPGGAVGAWETGRLAVRHFLARAGIGTEGLVLSDASGLSRSNRATADAIVQLLVHMYGHPEWEAFARSLSVAGRDGSLRKRMKEVPGVVCGKTGYMRGVRTLSGYVETPKGRTLCFSVLFNEIKGPTAPYNRIHDRVCHLLATLSEELPVLPEE